MKINHRNGGAVEVLRPINSASLGDKLGLWLRLAQQQFANSVNELLGEYDLKHIDFLVLGLIRDNPGRRQIAFAYALGMKQPNVACIMESLAERGHVVRAQDPQDRRATRISITEYGTLRLAAVEEKYTLLQHEILGSLATQPDNNLLNQLKLMVLLDRERRGTAKQAESSDPQSPPSMELYAHGLSR